MGITIIPNYGAMSLDAGTQAGMNMANNARMLVDRDMEQTGINKRQALAQRQALMDMYQKNRKQYYNSVSGQMATAPLDQGLETKIDEEFAALQRGLFDVDEGGNLNFNTRSRSQVQDPRYTAGQAWLHQAPKAALNGLQSLNITTVDDAMKAAQTGLDPQGKPLSEDERTRAVIAARNKYYNTKSTDPNVIGMQNQYNQINANPYRYGQWMQGVIPNFGEYFQGTDMNIGTSEGGKDKPTAIDFQQLPSATQPVQQPVQQRPTVIIPSATPAFANPGVAATAQALQGVYGVYNRNGANPPALPWRRAYPGRP